MVLGGQVPCLWCIVPSTRLQVPDSFRVVNDRDFVTALPPEVLIGRWVGAGNEVRIDHKGNIIIRPSIVERVFHTKQSRIMPHFMEDYKRSLEAVCTYYNLNLPPQIQPFRLLDVY